jgi:gamma-butyrobetaine dioxygenase
MRIVATSLPPGLAVQYADGATRPIHPLWLRERCNDPASRDALTGQRLYDPSDLDPHPAISAVREVGSGSWLVTFADGLQGSYATAEILAELPGAPSSLPARTPWTGALAQPPRMSWNANPSDAQWLRIGEAFLSHGFVIFTNVSREPGSVLNVARNFGVPRDTNFGLLFDVRTQPSATDLAYTGLALDAHTDNPYRDPVPGIQLLHCLINESTGGFSTLVDGFAVVEHLRESDPVAWDILTTTPVTFVYRDAATELIHRAPMIELDSQRDFCGIRFSPRLDFVPLLAPPALSAFYAARRKLDGLLRSAAFEIRFLLRSGDLVMFDNRRLLHGRTGFDPQQGVRHLQGCYIDMDGVHSRYRVLRRAAATSELAA